MSSLRKLRHWALVIGHCSFALGLCAEGADLQFRVLSWEGAIAGLKYDDRGHPVELFATDNTLSPPYTLANGIPLELYRESHAPEEKPPHPVATVTPPALGVGRAILILAAQSDGGYAGRWLDDSLDAHPANTVRVCNLARRPLAFQSGDARWTLAPGETRILPFAPTARQLPVRIAAQDDGQWKLLWGSNIPVRRNYRVHLIVKDRPPSGEAPGESLYPLLVHDYIPPPPPPARS